MEILFKSILWIKALHIIAIIAWMSGLLYLPRLFIYHCGAKIGSEMSETFKIMEHRLLHIIMYPAMYVSILSGGVMCYVYGYNIFGEVWFVVKLVCLFLLIAVHIILGRLCKSFKIDTNQKNQIYFRFINEVPTVLMVIIVIMVVVKPL